MILSSQATKQLANRIHAKQREEEMLEILSGVFETLRV
jgi:hypothetical protein